MEYHARHASLHSFTLNPHARATQGPAGARLMMHRSDTRRSHAPRAPRHGGTASPAAVRSHSPRPRAPSLTRHGHFATLPLCHFATSPNQYVLCHPVTFCHVSQPLCGTSPSTLSYAAISYRYSPSLTRPEHFVPRHPVIVCHVVSLSLRATSSSPVHCVPCQRLPPLPPPPLLAPGVPPGWSEGSHENGLLRSSSGSMSSSVNPPPSASSGHPPSSSYSTFADQGLGVGIQGFNLFRVEV